MTLERDAVAMLRDAAEVLTRAGMTAGTQTERAEYLRLARQCVDVANRMALRHATANHPANHQ
jgi:hypothetical protein